MYIDDSQCLILQTKECLDDIQKNILSSFFCKEKNFNVSG